MSAERLQKILAHAGIASRRKAEELIEQGLVTINGKVAKIGDKADLAADHIKVEGKLIQKAEEPMYVAFFKPKGVISMMADPEGRPTLADYLTKVKTRLFPIGRLDYNSEGLLLLTNDGDLAEKVQKSDQFPRVYAVKVKGHITAEMLKRLERGARINHKFIKPHSVRISGELNKKSIIEIVFLNAANLDVKSYFETRGFLIERMTRTAFGHITLKGLVPGQYRIVPQSKFQALIDQPDLGVKALDHQASKNEEVLPKDLQVDRRNQEKPTTISKTGKIRVRPLPAHARGPSNPTPREAPREDRPKRSFGENVSRPKRSFGERPAFGDRKPFGEKRSFGEKKSFGGERKSFGAKSSFGAAKPSFGAKPAFGAKPSFGEKPSFGRKASEGAPKRSFGGPAPRGRAITSVRKKAR